MNPMFFVAALTSSSSSSTSVAFNLSLEFFLDKGAWLLISRSLCTDEKLPGTDSSKIFPGKKPIRGLAVCAFPANKRIHNNRTNLSNSFMIWLQIIVDGQFPMARLVKLTPK